MIALYVFLSILLLIVVFLLLRARLLIEYSEKGFSADAKIGPVKVRAYPRAETEKEKKPKKARDINKPQTEAKEKKGGSLTEFKKFWSYFYKICKRFKLRLKVDDLRVHIAAGGTDPVNVALSYGGLNAAMGMIIPVLEQNFNIKNKDYATSFSFELKEPYIFIRASISAAIWEIIFVGWPIISMYAKDMKKRKEE